MSERYERIEKPRKNSKTVLIIVLVVMILALVLLIFILATPDSTEDTGKSNGLLVTPDNVQELIDNARTPVEDGYYTSSMNIDWYFENGTAATGNAYVENDVSNTRTVYFDLLLADSNEKVYTSPYIPVGSKLTDFSLETLLSAGDYNAVVEYHLVDDKNEEVSNVSVAVTLHILN